MSDKKLYEFEGFRLSPTPKGGLLFAYWIAVLRTFGMMTPGRKAQPRPLIGAFFDTGSLIRHHGSKGNLEVSDTGFLRLTVAGFNYFSGRLAPGAKQHVPAETLEAMEHALTTGELPDSLQGKGFAPSPVRVSVKR